MVVFTWANCMFHFHQIHQLVNSEKEGHLWFNQLMSSSDLKFELKPQTLTFHVREKWWGGWWRRGGLRVPDAGSEKLHTMIR